MNIPQFSAVVHTSVFQKAINNKPSMKQKAIASYMLGKKVNRLDDMKLSFLEVQDFPVILNNGKPSTATVNFIGKPEEISDFKERLTAASDNQELLLLVKEEINKASNKALKAFKKKKWIK